MAELYFNPPTIAPFLEDYRDRIERFGLRYEINQTGAPVTASALAMQAETAIAIVAGLEKYPAAFFSEASHLRTLAKYGVGFDNIDLNAARNNGTKVSVTAGSNSKSVADYTFAAILSLICRIPQRHSCVLSGHWVRQSHPSLSDKTIGIVGFGRIGKLVAERAKMLGWRVVIHDPIYSSAHGLSNVDAVMPLADLLPQVDVLTLHYPRKIDQIDFGYQELSLMKPGAIFVNMARGGLVDERVLAERLASGALGGAALDVFSHEPMIDVSLWRDAPNVLLSPHVAGSSEDAIRNGIEMCLETIEFDLGLRQDAPRAEVLI